MPTTKMAMEIKTYSFSDRKQKRTRKREVKAIHVSRSCKGVIRENFMTFPSVKL